MRQRVALMRRASRPRAAPHCARADSRDFASPASTRRRRAAGAAAHAAACPAARRSRIALFLRRMKRLTMRSSSEWKLMTHSRPPGCEQPHGLRQRGLELVQLAVDVNADRLERARRRMLARLARRHGPATSAASCRGARDRRLGAGRTMARAMRREKRSSPRLRITSTISARRPALATAPRSAPPRSIRMSSGPSCMKLKPRPAHRAAATRPPGPAARRPAPRPDPPPGPAPRASRTTPCTSVRRASPANRTCPARIASGSGRSRAPGRPGPARRESRRCARPARTSHRSNGRRPAPRARPAPRREVPACARPPVALERQLLELGGQCPSPRPPAARRRDARSSAARPRARNGCPARSASPAASSPAYSRSFGGTSTRPCESSSRSVACPTISRCSRRAWGFRSAGASACVRSLPSPAAGRSAGTDRPGRRSRSAALAALDQAVPVSRRHGHPPLGVERHFVGATKHAGTGGPAAHFIPLCPTWREL